jgi:deoxyribonuclease-4
MRQVRESLLPLLEDLHSAGPTAPRLLIEPTAGGGEALASSIEDLGRYLATLDWHPCLGVCLDTCHAYAAGHDLARPGGIRTMLNALVRTVGKGRLGLVHANDSKDPLGSGRDRHAPIGVGTIGVDPFAELFVHPATRGVPVVVETPGGERQHGIDVRLLQRLRDSAR